MCPSCKGAGQLRFQQGFFSVSRPCGQCEGSGQIITDPCTTCQGRQRVHQERTLSVQIPPGIETGMRLRLSNEGEHGVQGGPPGDLYVAITIKPHPVFRRQHLDIACDLPVNFVTATLGGKIEVPTLKGKTIMKIPAGTQPDKILRLKGLGFPSLKGNQTGDQIFNVKIEIPTKLSPRQKELLQDFAKESGMTPETDGDGFFDKMKTFFE
jgi:molecular chaperone DnaJ